MKGTSTNREQCERNRGKPRRKYDHEIIVIIQGFYSFETLMGKPWNVVKKELSER